MIDAARVLVDLLNDIFESIGLKQIKIAPYIFHDKEMSVFCYVDDLLLFTNREAPIKS